MTGHADTIRRGLEALRDEPDAILYNRWGADALAALDVLEAERQQLRTTIDYLLPANGCTTVDEAVAAFGGQR